jgi:hypothetical protein
MTLDLSRNEERIMESINHDFTLIVNPDLARSTMGDRFRAIARGAIDQYLKSTPDGLMKYSDKDGDVRNKARALAKEVFDDSEYRARVTSSIDRHVLIADSPLEGSCSQGRIGREFALQMDYKISGEGFKRVKQDFLNHLGKDKEEDIKFLKTTYEVFLNDRYFAEQHYSGWYFLKPFMTEEHLKEFAKTLAKQLGDYNLKQKQRRLKEKYNLLE